MRTFLLIWAGQLISLIGSGLTSFALSLWLYQRTGSTTLFALNALCAVLPLVVLSPLVGPLIDRWERRRALLACVILSACALLPLLLLVFRAALEYWHVYVATLLGAIARAFQLPAWMATTALLVDKQHLGRANGLVQLGQGITQVIAPALAGKLLEWLGLVGVLSIDLMTFIAALATLLAARIPHPPPGEAHVRPSFLRELAHGWSFIAARQSLLGLLAYVMLGNFLLGMVFILSTPLVLSFAPATYLGGVLSIAGSGFLLGSVVMSFWGGPRHRVRGVLGALMSAGLALILAGIQPSVPLVASASFLFMFCVPIASACNQAIWQAKTPHELQGRVFAMRSALAILPMPVAHLTSGLLADHVFEPLLAVEGALATTVGQLIGVGQGRGTGLVLIVAGLLTFLSALLGLLHPRLQHLEDELPDAAPVTGGAALASPKAL